MTNDKQRQRLVELIDRKNIEHAEMCTEMALAGNYGVPSLGECIADYLLANGVIVPPCKVGTTIYMIVEKRAKVTREWFRFIKKTKLTYLNLERVIQDFGKTVFLTQEDAEQALKARDES